VVEPADIHELAAGYVLDVLEPEEHDTFELHLERCTVCREELASLRWAAASLAFAAEGVVPPPALLPALLRRARRETLGTVVSLRHRFALPASVGLAATAAAAALVLGIWLASVSSSLDGERSARQAESDALAIVASPGAKRVPLRGARGAIVVTPERMAALVVAELPRAPSGKTYEAWVVAAGAPRPAGIFAGGPDHSIVVLTRPVPRNARVAVSVERAGGSQRLTGSLVFGTERA